MVRDLPLKAWLPSALLSTRRNDITAVMKRDPTEPEVDASDDPREPRDDDVIRIEDLTPPDNVRGGRKLLLGEMHTPLSSPKAKPQP